MKDLKNTPANSPLGKPSNHADRYDPSLLFPIARARNRQELGLGDAPPFFGADMWTAFELSWLNARGKPQVALARFTIPCESANIIESKSFKLYLNSFSNTRLADPAEVRQRLCSDLSEAAWRGSEAPASVGVQLLLAQRFDRESLQELAGLSLDRLDLECSQYQPAPERLTTRAEEGEVTEVLKTDLFRSNCPITGQPDWGSFQISYHGAPIDQEGLLQYLVSFRNHSGFHEQCVERVFMDIWRRCRPLRLTVYARFTRRGGIDINPFRTSHPQPLPANLRNARQ